MSIFAKIELGIIIFALWTLWIYAVANGKGYVQGLKIGRGIPNDRE